MAVMNLTAARPVRGVCTAALACAVASLLACAGPQGPAGKDGKDGVDGKNPEPAPAPKLPPPELPDPNLAWHARSLTKLNELITSHGIASASFDPAHRPVAVFDWDNTILKNDIGDATMFWMLRNDKILQPANRDWGTTSPGLTTAAKMELSAACDMLANPGEPLPTSTDTACSDAIFDVYYDEVTPSGAAAWTDTATTKINYAYAWVAQLQAGYTPAQIREMARSAYFENATHDIGAKQLVGTKMVAGYVRLYAEHRDLIRTLKANGFDVWITTASPQYVVDAISDLVDVPDDHVIGIRNVLVNGVATTDLQGCGDVADKENTLITFDTGKRCWINKVIFHVPVADQLKPQTDPLKRPTFVAGDSDTDIAMLKDATALKFVLNRNKTQIMCNALANAHDSWIWEPMFIEPKAQKTSPYPCTTAKDPDGNAIVDEDGKPFAMDYVEPASP